MYDLRMMTVLISGRAPVPEPLRELVERGSTSLREQNAAELAGTPMLDADRIVLWSVASDPPVRRLAEEYAKAEAAQRREILVFVTSGHPPAASSTRLSPQEIFAWRADEDRLKMAFLTGA